MFSIKTLEEIREESMDSILINNAVDEKLKEIESQIMDCLRVGTEFALIDIGMMDYNFSGLSTAASARLVGYFVVKTLEGKKYNFKYKEKKDVILIEINLQTYAGSEFEKKLENFFK